MAAPSHVQNNYASASNVSSLAVTLSSAVTGSDVSSGNTLVACVACSGFGIRNISSFSDDNSNSWNTDQDIGSILRTQGIGSADNVNAGATTVTITLTASDYINFAVCEISGADATDAYDTGDTNQDSTNDNDDKCSSGLTTSSNVFVLAGGANNATHSGLSAPSGWTLIDTGSNAYPYAFAYIESDAGLTSDEIVFTHAGTARTWNGSVAAYKAAAAAGATPKNPFGLALYGPMQRAVR